MRRSEVNWYKMHCSFKCRRRKKREKGRSIISHQKFMTFWILFRQTAAAALWQETMVDEYTHTHMRWHWNGERGHQRIVSCLISTTHNNAAAPTQLPDIYSIFWLSRLGCQILLISFFSIPPKGWIKTPLVLKSSSLQTPIFVYPYAVLCAIIHKAGKPFRFL